MGGSPDAISKVHVRTANAGLPTFYNVSATNFDPSVDVGLNIAANCIQLR